MSQNPGALAPTPGPWTYQENSDAYTHIVRGPDGHQMICHSPQGSDPRHEADMRLVAASPEMRDALLKIEALILETKYCPAYVSDDDWNPLAHCDVTLTIEAVRGVYSALDKALSR